MTSGLTRRELILRAGVVGGGVLLQACAPAPSAPIPGTSSTSAPAAPTSVGTRTTATSGVLPTYVPSTGGPQPDFPAANPQQTVAFSRNPPNPSKALPN